MRKSLKIILLSCLILFVSVTAFAGEKYKFFVPLAESLADSSMAKLLSDMTKAMAEETGYDLEFHTFGYKPGCNVSKQVFESLKKDEYQMSYMNAIEYVMLRDQYEGVFEPMFTVTFDNKEYADLCMYVGADSKIEKVEDTRGLVWGGPYTDHARLLLYENGIDEPLSSFYSGVKYVDSTGVSSMIEKLDSGEIETFVGVKQHISMSGKESSSKNGQKKGPIYKEVYCTPYEHNWIFGFSNKVPKEVSRKITSKIIKAHKDAKFNRFHFMFYAIKGHFVPFDEKNLQRTIEVAKLIKNQDWIKEREDLIKKSVGE